MWWKQQDSEEKILYAALDVLAKSLGSRIAPKIKGRVLKRPSRLSTYPTYFGGGGVVAGLVPPAGAAGLLLVPAGLVVSGLVGAATPDCAL